LGVWLLTDAIRSPLPAARIMAFTVGLRRSTIVEP
jgi:hypothetical protein